MVTPKESGNISSLWQKRDHLRAPDNHIHAVVCILSARAVRSRGILHTCEVAFGQITQVDDFDDAADR